MTLEGLAGGAKRSDYTDYDNGNGKGKIQKQKDEKFRFLYSNTQPDLKKRYTKRFYLVTNHSF